jgi:hypothetical protein
VTRAPTHEPYPYHNQGVDLSLNLGEDTSTENTTPDNNTDLLSRANTTYKEVSTSPVINPIDAADYLSVIPAGISIPAGYTE